MTRMCIRLVAGLALLMGVVYGQSIYGTLTGTVWDSSGAVVPGVNITVTNEKSGDVRKTVTNGSGFFDVAALPAGSYSVTAETSGFGKYQVTGVTLNSAENKTMKIELTLASSVEHVQVVAATDQLVTVDSGEKSALITSHELQNLTLLGRNAAELIKILPGAAMVANGGVNGQAYTGENYGINGAGLGGNQGGNGGTNINGQIVDITMDGAHTYDPGAPGGATPVNPNVEMIQEIKILTSNFAAENTQSGVVMNTVSKSGGRDFHGAGYLTARNAVLNSADWANNALGAPKPDSNYYFPGGNIGGPVLLPFTKFNRQRDKLFFFEGYEYYRQTIDGGVDRAFVPTLDERNGDFSQAASMGPLQGNLGVVPTGYGVVGGVIPQQLIDPGAKILMNLYPKPNVDPIGNNGYNYVTALIAHENSWQSLSRVDYSVSDNTKLFVRYNAQREQQNQPTGMWGGPGCDNCVPNPSNIIGANGSDAISSSLTHVFSPTMTSETTFAYTRVNFPDYPEDPTKLQRKESGYPYKGIYHDSDTNPVLGVSWDAGIPVLGRNGYDFTPNGQMYARSGDWNVSENLSKVIGTHSMKFGAYYELVGHDETNWTQSNGYFEYSSWASNTGNNYADLLMGQGFSSYLENSYTPPGNFANQWIEFYAQDHWKITSRLTIDYGIRFSHMPTPYDRAGIGLAVFDPTKYSNDPSQVNAHTGLEWHGMNKSVPNSGIFDTRLFFYSPRFGLAYDVFGNGKTVLRGGWGKYRTPLGTQQHNTTSPQSTAAGESSYSCGFNQDGCLTWASVDQLTVAPIQQGPSSGYTTINVTDPHDDEEQLVTSYSFSIDQQLPGNFLLETSYVGNQGNYGPTTVDINAVPFGTVIPGDASSVDPYRPMVNYQSINQNKNIMKSEYDSLQASLRRSVGFLNLQANYTFSKSMAHQNVNASLPNYGLDYYWGVNPGNRPQVLSLAYTLTTPKMELGNRVANGIANNWQISGITQFESGPDLIAQSTNFNFSETNLSANQIAGIQLQPILLCNPTSGLGKNQYLNPACFGPAPSGTLGAGVFPYLPGPAFWNSDLALTRKFSITERQILQFRFSAFNFLNHPLTTFHSGDGNLYLTYDATGHLQTQNFGVAQYKTGHRVIELSVKYLF